MKNKTRRLAAFLLSAAVVITAVPGMQERVYAQKTGGYTESPKSENVPVVQETKSRLKKAEAVPSAYMNKLSELTIRYPGVRDQGKYDTCWAFGERVARNMPIQGAAADIIKIAMIRVSSRLAREGLQGKLILQVHDELIVECPPEEREQVERILQEEMEGAVRLSVPMVAEAGSGRTWFEAKE